MALRCLIVDDNPAFLRAARVLLEGEGVHVVGVASTGAEAVGCVAELRPDVTLLDIDLGEDSGFDLARRLDEDPGLDAGRLILISAHAQEDLAELVEGSPALGFLSKEDLSAVAIDQLVRAAGTRPGGSGGTSGR